MPDRKLVVMAFWTESDKLDEIHERLRGVPIVGSGGVGQWPEEQVNEGLRADLARVAEEFKTAANWLPPASGTEEGPADA